MNNNEIKEILEFDHFKDLEELKRNVECWIAEDEMYWERWFGLRDIKTLLDYITNLQEDYDRAMKLVDKGVENSYIKIKKQQKEIQRYKKFVDDILNFYMHKRYLEELTEDNMFKFVLNQNEMILTIEEFKGDE